MKIYNEKTCEMNRNNAGPCVVVYKNIEEKKSIFIHMRKFNAKCRRRVCVFGTVREVDSATIYKLIGLLNNNKRTLNFLNFRYF